MACKHEIDFFDYFVDDVDVVVFEYLDSTHCRPIRKLMKVFVENRFESYQTEKQADLVVFVVVVVVVVAVVVVADADCR